MKSRKMRVVLLKTEIHEKLKERKKETGINIERQVAFAVIRYLQQEEKPVKHIVVTERNEITRIK